MMDVKHSWNQSFKPLIAGLLISALLTFAAWLPVKEHTLDSHILIPLVLGLGFIQMLVQMVLFLNLGIESKPKWNLMMFFFMLTVLFIIIGGSMWIMYHLDYNMTSMGGH